MGGALTVLYGTIAFTSATAQSPWMGASNPLTWQLTPALADGESFLSQKTGDCVGLVPSAEVTHDMLALVHTCTVHGP